MYNVGIKVWSRHYLIEVGTKLASVASLQRVSLLKIDILAKKYFGIKTNKFC